MTVSDTQHNLKALFQTDKVPLARVAEVSHHEAGTAPISSQ